MRPNKTLGLAIAFVFCMAFAARASAAQSPLVVTPDKIHWMPGTGALKGTQVAVLDGDPARTGEYTMRIKFPDGMRLPVHIHNHPERITVISGTLLVAVGDKIVPANKMVVLTPGAYADVPPGLHHYAMARGETIIQISSEGPRSMTAVHMKM